jgi:hypothetical protein
METTRRWGLSGSIMYRILIPALLFVLLSPGLLLTIPPSSDGTSAHVVFALYYTY